MKIYLAQLKPYLGDVDKNIKKMEREIEIAKNQGSEIIIFPELFLTGTILGDLIEEVATEEIPKKILELSQDITIIYGGVEKAKNGKLYNTGYCLEDGKLIGKHRKNNFMKKSVFSENEKYTNGKETDIIESKIGKIVILMEKDCSSETIIEKIKKEKLEYVIILGNTYCELSFSGEFENQYDLEISNLGKQTGATTIFCNRVGVEDGITFLGNSKIIDSKGKTIVELEKIREMGIAIEL